jgi:hypothetical protein
MILLITLIVAKDIYISGLERSFNFKPRHIIQEVMIMMIYIMNDYERVVSDDDDDILFMIITMSILMI